MNKNLEVIVDTRLATLEWTQGQSNGVLAQVEGEPKAVKKMTAGFVLVIVLLLVTLSAIATGLLMNEFRTNVVQHQNETHFLTTWDDAAKEQMYKMMLQYGIVDDRTDVQDLIRSWRDGDDAIAYALKIANGEPFTWTVAEQRWAEELLFESGFAIDILSELPNDDDFSETEVLQKAKAAVLAKYPDEKEAIDMYQTHISYGREMQIASKKWQVLFRDKETNADKYTVFVYLSGDASVVLKEQQEGLLSQSIDGYEASPSTAKDYEQALLVKKGSPRKFTLEEKARLAALQAAEGSITPRKAVLPTAESISQDKAIEIANAIFVDNGFALDEWEMDVGFILSQDTLYLWVIDYYQEGEEEIITVTLDAANGQLITLLLPGQANG